MNNIAKEMRRIASKSSVLIAAKELIRPDPDGLTGVTKINFLRSFPLYLANSAGNYRDRAELAIQSINRIFPCLSNLAHSLGHEPVQVEDIRLVADSEAKRSSVQRLEELFNCHGSDKANGHVYHFLYGAILQHPNDIARIFEIGLGTNNTDIVSNMGSSGRPGASLRAFRDYCPSAQIFGADIDRRVLFDEDRITTRFIDQTEPDTFQALLSELPRDFDLFIDDGLHLPDANVSSLQFGLQLLKVGGWAIIEDIPITAIPVWQIVAAMLPDNMKPRIFDADGTILFAVHREA